MGYTEVDQLRSQVSGWIDLDEGTLFGRGTGGGTGQGEQISLGPGLAIVSTVLTSSAPPLNRVTITDTDSPYTLTDENDIIFVDATTDDVTITLSDPATALAKQYVFKLIAVGAAKQMVLDGDGADIDGMATQTALVANASFTLVPDSDSGAWWITAQV